MTRTFAALCCAASLALVSGDARLTAARQPDMMSRWRTIEMTVDGQSDEWKELNRVPKANLSAAFVNDGEALYICLTTSDENARRQILREGLQLWLDVQGGQKKRIGIRFPAMSRAAGPGGPDGSGRGGPPPGDWGGSETSSDRSGGGRRQPPPGDPTESRIPPEMQRRVEILGQRDSDRRVVLLEETPGLEAHVGVEEGVLVWEARLPIAKTRSDLWAFVAAPGTVIGVGFETSAPEMGRPPGGMGGGMGPGGGGGMGPGGGMGGGGRGPGGGMGGGMGGGGRGPGGGMGPGGVGMRPPDMGSQVKSWLTVQLASAE
jgi:hypothetical protein